MNYKYKSSSIKMLKLKEIMIAVAISVVLFFNVFSFYIKSDSKLEYIDFGDEGAYTFFDEDQDEEISETPHHFIDESRIYISKK